MVPTPQPLNVPPSQAQRLDMVEGTNKLMTHAGAKSLAGTQFQMSFEVLILELGLSVSDQPFLEDYSKYSAWVTRHSRAAN